MNSERVRKASRVERGKDRYAMLSPQLLDLLRAQGTDGRPNA
jgi:hypothetical protein